MNEIAYLRRKRLGVVGLGTVGWAIYHALSKDHDCVGYDIFGDHDWSFILKCQIVFICVSTPKSSDGDLDCSAVIDVIDRLCHDQYSGIIVICSTLRVGFMDGARVRYPGMRLLYMPEFLREKNPYSWCAEPDRIVLSGLKDDIDLILEVIPRSKNVPILIICDRAAEIGKLAHNAYIATKVSFTNEIEAIARTTGVDPHDPMSVIWADRRVCSTDHLTPGLGPYDGKCVPKDTDALKTYARKVGIEPFLFDACKAINERVPLPPSTSSNHICIIIPTLQQDDLLRRALTSVVNQTLLPEMVLIVYDGEQGLTSVTSDIIQSYIHLVRVIALPNDRTQNLAGAINTGIQYLNHDQAKKDDVFIAFLDDDDYWDRRYLQNCHSFAHDMGCEWVVSGLIRHDVDNSRYGSNQSLPIRLSIDDFLVGNPGIQGSNLFITLKRLLESGGFDESLESTTDRDICIRLLDLPGMRYGILRNHLVHHDAFSRPDRLSTKGSMRKERGLQAFFRKYSEWMTPEQMITFSRRANDLFGVKIELANTSDIKNIKARGG